MGPKSCFWGRPPSDMTVIYHSWAHYSAPTTPGELFHPIWTKSDLSTFPRDGFRSETIIVWPFLSPEKVYTYGERIVRPVPVKMST